MRILFEEATETYDYVTPTILIPWIIIVAALFILCVWIGVEKKKDYLSTFFAIIDAIIFFGGLIIITTTRSPGPITRYVCFDNNDSFENHLDEYELVERKGDLYIIKDKE